MGDEAEGEFHTPYGTVAVVVAGQTERAERHAWEVIAGRGRGGGPLGSVSTLGKSVVEEVGARAWADEIRSDPSVGVYVSHEEVYATLLAGASVREAVEHSRALAAKRRAAVAEPRDAADVSWSAAGEGATWTSPEGGDEPAGAGGEYEARVEYESAERDVTLAQEVLVDAEARRDAARLLLDGPGPRAKARAEARLSGHRYPGDDLVGGQGAEQAGRIVAAAKRRYDDEPTWTSEEDRASGASVEWSPDVASRAAANVGAGLREVAADRRRHARARNYAEVVGEERLAREAMEERVEALSRLLDHVQGQLGLLADLTRAPDRGALG